MLTQKELKRQLKYDKNTGIFTRKLKQIGRGKVGDIVGTLTNVGYICISINSQRYQAHQLAWLYEYGCFPDKCIDHINRIRTDNRIKNLRNVEIWENNINKDIQKNNTTGYTGISINKNRFHVRIKKNYKCIHIGYYNNIEDAIKNRKIAEKKYFNK